MSQAPTSMPPQQQPGRLGKYELLCRLGQGGMAEVFKGHRVGPGGFDKVVVIKRVLREHLEEPEFIRMFLDEARLAANLSHPNLVQIFDIDELDGVPYLAMEYVCGPTLQTLVRAARRKQDLRLGCVAKILSKVCDGLHHAHHARDVHSNPLAIVHRDVTPQNILVSQEGIPKVVDFGVAKARGRLTSSDAGVVKGKLHYVAPEQLRGAEVDGRADVFGVGVCLYEATTGHFPFDGPSEAQVMQALLDGRFEPPSRWVEGYPRQLEEVVSWALEPRVDKRCPDAKTLQEALEAFVTDGPYAARTQEVAAWVDDMFPDQGGPPESRFVLPHPTVPPQLPSPEVSGAVMVSERDLLPMDPTSRLNTTSGIPQRRRRQRALWLAAGGLGVALMGGALMVDWDAAAAAPDVIAGELVNAPSPAPVEPPAVEPVAPPPVPAAAVEAAAPPAAVEPAGVQPAAPEEVAVVAAPAAVQTPPAVARAPLSKREKENKRAAAPAPTPVAAAAAMPPAAEPAAVAPAAAAAPAEPVEPGTPTAQDIALARRTLKIAESQFAAHDLDKALRTARLAIALDPNHPAAHTVLGLILAASGDCASANNQFAQALMLDKTDSRAQAGRLACQEL